MKSVTASLVAIVFLIGAPSESAADREPTVAVFVAESFGLQPGEPERVLAEFARALNAELRVLALPMHGKKPAANCVGDMACITGIGKSANADQVVAIVLVRVGNDIRIETIWVELQDQQLRVRPPIVVRGAAGVYTAVRDQAPSLIGDAKPRDERGRGGRHFTKTSAVIGITGVTMTAIGLGFGFAALMEHSTVASKACAFENNCSNDDVSRLRRFNAAGTFFVVSGVLTTVVAGLLYLGSGQRERRPGTPVPSLAVSEDSFSVGFSAAF